MRVLLAVFVLGFVGCSDDPSQLQPEQQNFAENVERPATQPIEDNRETSVSATPPGKKPIQKQPDKSVTFYPEIVGAPSPSVKAAQHAEAVVEAAVGLLRKRGAFVRRNKTGEVVEVEARNLLELKLLSKLPKLQVLRLYGEKIFDAGLVHIKGLTKLETLVLGNTDVTDAGLVHLKEFPNLQTLELRGTKVTDTGLRHLKNLSNLKDLSLSRTKITDAGFVHLKGLTKLETLDIWGTKITDAGFMQMKALANLKSLTVGASKITETSLVSLSNLAGLHELEILGYPSDGFDPTDDTFEPSAMVDINTLLQLKKMTDLKSLRLVAVKLGDAEMRILGGNKTLQRLALDFSAITDKGVGHLRAMDSLQELSMSHIKITGYYLSNLKNLLQLRTLRLAHTSLNDEGLVQLKRLTELQEIDLTNTSFTDDGLIYLKGLAGLRTLRISDTNVTDDGLAHLAQLENLQQLELGCFITDAGCQHFEKMSKLHTLSIGGGMQKAEVTDAGLVHLMGMAALERIQFYNCSVTSNGVTQLRKSLPNCTVINVPVEAPSSGGFSF